MADQTKTKNLCCLGCLANSEETQLKNFTFQNVTLKSTLQMEQVCLCYVCKRMAQHLDLFVRNVQSNQILLENYNIGSDPAFEIVRSQTQPLIRLTYLPIDVIALSGIDEMNEESATIVHSSVNDLEVKVEALKEEDEMPNSLDDFVDDSDFQAAFVKEEADDYPLNELNKELENNIYSKQRNRNYSKLKTKKKKIKCKEECDAEISRKGISTFKQIFITKEQCLKEREMKMKSDKYLNSVFKCTDCVKGFMFKGSYDKHMENHSETMGVYECDICKQRTNTKEKLLAHMRYHEIRYQCAECEQTRVCRATMKDHYNTYHCLGFLQYTCEYCSKQFKRKSALRKHIFNRHREKKERVPCVYCSKTYACTDVLKRHLITQHPAEVSAGVPSKLHACAQCGAAFGSPSQLKRHGYKHSDAREHYCVECDKSFKSEDALKYHLTSTAIHVNYMELRYPCLHCEKRFATKRGQQCHINRIHLNIKPFQCNICDKAYISNWALAEHKRLIHEGYKRPLKFPCPMCDRHFDRKQILKAHLRTHTGERPYQCDKCPAAFGQSSALGTHNKLVHLRLTRDGKPKASVK